MRWNIRAYLFIGHFSFLFYESSLHSFIPFVFIDGIIFFKSMICRNSYCRYFPQFDICISVWFIRLFALKKVLKEIYLLCSHSYYLPLPFLKWFMALFFTFNSYSLWSSFSVIPLTCDHARMFHLPLPSDAHSQSADGASAALAFLSVTVGQPL